MTAIEGSVAVVTGGASGIGRGIAEEFTARGAEVVIADLDEARLRETAAEIGVLPVVTDVSRADSVQALAAEVLSRFGRVDILVNNAGVGPVGEVASLSLADWRWVLDVNLWGVLHGIDSFLPHLLANPRGGHLVNTTSFAVFDPLPGLAAYSVAKFGVQAVSETLALELAETHPDVHVTILPPGPVRTNIRESLVKRPAGERGGLRDADLTAEAPDLRWIQPRTVGRILARAVEADALYAITHPEWWPRVAQRVGRLQEDFERFPAITE